MGWEVFYIFLIWIMTNSCWVSEEVYLNRVMSYIQFTVLWTFNLIIICQYLLPTYNYRLPGRPQYIQIPVCQQTLPQDTSRNKVHGLYLKMASMRVPQKWPLTILITLWQLAPVYLLRPSLSLLLSELGSNIEVKEVSECPKVEWDAEPSAE